MADMTNRDRVLSLFRMLSLWAVILLLALGVGFNLAAVIFKFTTMEVRIQNATNEVRRLEEQQLRIIQALDNTYEELQQHLRGEPVNPKPFKFDEKNGGRRNP